jgi:fructose-1,6-bisphosphatase I
MHTHPVHPPHPQPPQGEEQKKLDVISNDIFSMCLRNCGRTGVIASEEEENPIAVEETTSGNYIVVFDPLDGSSNIDAGGWDLEGAA